MSWGLLGVRACIVLGIFLSAFYVTSQLRQVGELKESVAVRDARLAEFAASQQALRTEIEELSTATKHRDLNARAITTAIDRLRTEAKEEKNACDDEQLSAAYVDRLRKAAAIATAGTASVQDSP